MKIEKTGGILTTTTGERRKKNKEKSAKKARRQKRLLNKDKMKLSLEEQVDSNVSGVTLT